MPQNLNHFGVLFGGYMLMWVDEIAWIAATMEYPGHRFVTIGMDHVEFKHGVKQGTILTFETSRTHVGNTSVKFLVNVLAAGHEGTCESIFSTTVTLVNVDQEGKKVAVRID